jgi:peptidoglycan/LPS O-acetylase OafA/YrhL
MLFHARLGCPGGYVGVDIFFVISGFLISSLILNELRDGVFSLIAFWERRIRRILPALVTVVIATLVAGWFLYLPRDLKHVGRSVVGQATLISNFMFVGDTDYFAPGSDAGPLLHTWSLAVEEQFYLVYPLLLILLTQSRRLPLSKAILCLAIGSFVACVVGSYSDLPTTFYLLPTRAWELMMGAWLATTRGRLSANEGVRESAGWLGLGLAAYGVLCYDRFTRFPGLAAIPPCLGAALIIFSSESRLSRVGRLLAFKPVVFVGLISYSLYLWHWPLLVFSHYQARGEYSMGFRIVLLAAGSGLAWLSWRYVEVPIHKRRVLLRRWQVFGLAGVSMATLLGLGVMAYRLDGFPARFPPNALHYADGWKDRAFLNVITLEQAQSGQFVELGTRDTNQPISLLIWGDSHAMAITPVLDDLCRRFSRRGVQATQVTTAPVLNYASPGAYSLGEDSLAFARAVLTFISERRVRTVVIAARWAR